MNPSSHTKPCQRDRLFTLLKDRAPNWASLPEILALGIAQYNARIYELRHLGHRIENRQEGDRSWFRLVTTLTPVTLPELHSTQEPPARLESLFGDLPPDARYPD
jgi:hypothetical protein